jgi:hypothetical protein
MSKFIGGQDSFRPSILFASDERGRMPVDRWNDTSSRALPYEDGALWYSSRMMGGDPTVPMCFNPLVNGKWSTFPMEGGNQTMNKLVGITRDSSGNILGSAIVKVFLTATDQELRQVTSDAGGYFELPSEYAGSNHYLVAYKAGSPDVAGTTVNTLQPT